MRRSFTAAALAVTAAAGLVTSGYTADRSARIDRDHGSSSHSDDWEHASSSTLRNFGITRAIPASSTVNVDTATALANPLSLITVAPGLKAKVVTSGNAAPNLDMGALWPASHPTHLFFCNEQGPTDPGVQRIDLATGTAVTVLTGTKSCDPLHVTPWGTIVFGEEAGATGAVYEMIDPMSVVGATLDRTTGVASTPNIVRRDALGSLSFEGLGILPNGVAYYGDELGPKNGAPGGSYFKFVPSTPYAGTTPITSLDQSPLASGSVFGLRVSDGSNYGPAMALGQGAWIPIPGASGAQLRTLAPAAGLTGYYRPEDLALDLKALAAGDVRWCGNNTGRDESRYFGETICLTDGRLTDVASGASTPEVELFVVGNQDLNMPDNIDNQPGRGNWIIHEDGSTYGAQGGDHNDDLWSCMSDGADIDAQSDGCVRVAVLNDLEAEFTGGFFDPTGRHFYVSLQHNDSGFGTLVDITGWR